jgi:hypothetical protein
VFRNRFETAETIRSVLKRTEKPKKTRKTKLFSHKLSEKFIEKRFNQKLPRGDIFSVQTGQVSPTMVFRFKEYGGIRNIVKKIV